MKTAKLIKQLNDSQSLYECNPPLGWSDSDKSYEFVVASINLESSQKILGYAEVYLFGADKSGNIVDWVELPGSMKHTSEHNRAFENAGYTIQDAAMNTTIEFVSGAPEPTVIRDRYPTLGENTALTRMGGKWLFYATYSESLLEYAFEPSFAGLNERGTIFRAVSFDGAPIALEIEP